MLAWREKGALGAPVLHDHHVAWEVNSSSFEVLEALFLKFSPDLLFFHRSRVVSGEISSCISKTADIQDFNISDLWSVMWYLEVEVVLLWKRRRRLKALRPWGSQTLILMMMLWSFANCRSCLQVLLLTEGDHVLSRWSFLTARVLFCVSIIVAIHDQKFLTRTCIFLLLSPSSWRSLPSVALISE